MSNSSTATPTTYQSEPNRPTPDQRTVWLFSLLFLCGLIVFVLLVGKKEVARWHCASSANAIEDERYDDAIQAANSGLGWNPDYVELIRLRSVAHFAQENYEACLADYDRMQEILSKDEVTNEADLALKENRANVLLRMKRFAETIAIRNEIVEYRKEQHHLRDDFESLAMYAMALNNRAYIEAQAHTMGEEVDLKAALEDIKKAIRDRKAEDDPVMVDTLGYLLLLNGENEDALHHLNKAVEMTLQENEIRRSRYIQAMQRVVDQRPFEALLEQLDQQYSIILHHRGEAYMAVGETEKANADMEEAKRLGYDPDAGIW